MHKEKSAFPQSPGIRARSDYIISAHPAEVNQYTTISQELEHLQGWGLHITQHSDTSGKEKSNITHTKHRLNLRDGTEDRADAKSGPKGNAGAHDRQSQVEEHEHE